MNVKCLVLAMCVALAIPFLGKARAEVTGQITSVTSTVNGILDTYFTGSGDRLGWSAASSMSVGAGDPAIAFTQRIWITDSTGEIFSSPEGKTVQPGTSDTMSDVFYFTVPFVHESFYYTYAELFYYDEEANKVSLDFDYGIFSAD